jgi:hypothetical protein
MAKTKAAVVTPTQRKFKAHKRVKTKEDRFDDFSFNNHNLDDEEGPNWYNNDEDAIRRIEAIRPQRDWDDEDGFSAWWNWGN